MAKQFSSIKHPFLKFDCFPFYHFPRAEPWNFVCVIPETVFSHSHLIFCHVIVFGAGQSIFFTILLKWASFRFNHFRMEHFAGSTSPFSTQFCTHCTSTFKLGVTLLKSSAYYGSFSRFTERIHKEIIVAHLKI